MGKQTGEQVCVFNCDTHNSNSHLDICNKMSRLQGWYQDKKLPDKNPPDINLWTKTPLPKTPQRKLMNTKYILHK